MQHAKDSISESCIWDKIGVKPSDGEVGLGHGDFDVANQGDEERETLHHLAEKSRVLRIALGEFFQRVTDSEPGRHRVAALHPAKDPRDSAQVIEVAAGAAPRWARPDARMFQFVDGSGLLEI